MWSRRAVLGAGLAAASARAWAQAGDPELLAVGKKACGAVGPLPEGPSLRAAAKARGLYFGSAVKDSLFSNADYRRLVLHECEAISCIYSMKLHMLQPQPKRFNFREADAYVDFAVRNKLRMHGHTLVWHEVLPPWINSALKNKPHAVMERHIRTVMGRYAGLVHSWDVVNEPTSGRSPRADSLRPSAWLEALGPDYIRIAFEIAHDADPKAKLVMNTNASPYRNQNTRLHYENMVRLIERLLGQKAPLQAVGIQGHLDAVDRGRFADNEIAWFCAKLGEMKLPLIITELDCSDKGIATDRALRDDAVGEAYRQFLAVVLAAPTLEGIICWGLSDRESGHNRWPRPDGMFVRGLPYDVCLSPKRLRAELLNALSS